MPPIIDRNKCTGCGICADICPLDVFYYDENYEFPIVANEEECWHCNACVLDCPSEAVRLRIPLPAMLLYVDAVKEGK